MSLVRVTGALPNDCDWTGDDLCALVRSQQTVIPEDTIDVALRNAKTEEEFDAIYAYSGRPVIGCEPRDLLDDEQFKAQRRLA